MDKIFDTTTKSLLHVHCSAGGDDLSALLTNEGTGEVIPNQVTQSFFPASACLCGSVCGSACVCAGFVPRETKIWS